eukprot:NODE_4817_length_1843_cov_2.393939.p1 GENE.NODE_4817_length_1843_cov_2.393939~~NODE_4817_length_1843_cov_2.393939.p1  ORF type:complete len:469 (-),score=103.60 NODE_4817_length_1843_cov_2.393939:199-1605(-)
MELAPDRVDVYEASGELLLAHGRFNEAVAAFDTAAKLAGGPSARAEYERAPARVMQGQVSAALAALSSACRLNPGLAPAVRARAGVTALQQIIAGEYRQARVRLNALLHAPLGESLASTGSGLAEGLPPLFKASELLFYRGLCSIYLGDGDAGLQDTEAALELSKQSCQNFAHEGFIASRDSSASARREGDEGDDSGIADDESAPSASLVSPAPFGTAAAAPPEGSTSTSTITPPAQAVAAGTADACPQEAPPSSPLESMLECGALYNAVLCLLLAHEYQGALLALDRFLTMNSAVLQASARGLAWFLAGICRLALDGGDAALGAREAFARSYTYVPHYVDDFLRRMGPAAAPLRPVGGCAPPPRGSVLPRRNAAHVCDTPADGICCLQVQGPHLGSRLPPFRIEAGDVVIWARPSAPWPAFAAPGLALRAGLARLTLPVHDELGVEPLLPYGGLATACSQRRAAPAM